MVVPNVSNSVPTACTGIIVSNFVDSSQSNTEMDRY